jgi:hypothetical protein
VLTRLRQSGSKKSGATISARMGGLMSRNDNNPQGGSNTNEPTQPDREDAWREQDENNQRGR